MIIVISIYPIQFSFHFKSPFSPLKIYVKKKNIYISENSISHWKSHSRQPKFKKFSPSRRIKIAKARCTSVPRYLTESTNSCLHPRAAAVTCAMQRFVEVVGHVEKLARAKRGIERRIVTCVLLVTCSPRNKRSGRWIRREDGGGRARKGVRLWPFKFYSRL